MSMANGDNRISVVLTDDHKIVRHAIKTLLESDPRYELVAECSGADETVEIVERLGPDLLILDLGLPGKSGIEAIFELTQRRCSTKIIVLTMFEDDSKVRQSFSAGARGYILKNSSPQEFLKALEVVRNDGLYLSDRVSHLSSELEALVASVGKRSEHDLDPLAKLSKREREVFFLLADGIPNRVIAKKLFISPRTVETHRARVIKKLGFASTADLIRYAIRNNLMSL